MSLRVPTFSVLCAAYQAEDTVGRAVRSVLAQTCGDWEMIVCDDGSSDDTGQATLQAAAGDTRVSVIRQQNAGPGSARNLAAGRARGEFLCILDSDDEMDPGYLDVISGLIESHPGADIYSCNARVLDSGGAEGVWDVEISAQEAFSLSLPEMLQRNRIFVMATVRAETFHRMGGFDTSSLVEDYDLWLRILAAGGRHVGTGRTLGIYHRHAGATSASAAKQWRATAGLLARYAEDASLDERARDIARDSAHRYEAMARLEELDVDAVAGLGRRNVYPVLTAYDSFGKRLLGATLITLSPRLFVEVVTGRRRKTLKNRYGNDAGGER